MRAPMEGLPQARIFKGAGKSGFKKGENDQQKNFAGLKGGTDQQKKSTGLENGRISKKNTRLGELATSDKNQQVKFSGGFCGRLCFTKHCPLKKTER